MLLHPSSSVYADLIFRILHQHQLAVVAAYHVSSWLDILECVYRYNLQKSKDAMEYVYCHAYVNSCFFGNCALLVLLNKDIPYEELVSETLQVKSIIRHLLNKTKDGTISLYVDVDYVMTTWLKRSEPVITQNVHSNYDLFAYGSHRQKKIILTHVHCPDTVEQFYEDFICLDAFMKESYLLHSDAVSVMIKNKSYERSFCSTAGKSNGLSIFIDQTMPSNQRLK